LDTCAQGAELGVPLTYHYSIWHVSALALSLRCYCAVITLSLRYHCAVITLSLRGPPL